MGHTIMVKELVPIVVAAAVWGARWSGHAVLAQSDNMAVVEVLFEPWLLPERRYHASLALPILR